MKRRSFVTAGASLVASAAFGNVFRRSSGRRTTDLLGKNSDLLLLPEGFSYQVIDRTGDEMSDGYRVAGSPDAMATFRLSDSQFALMRNHELSPSESANGFLRQGQPVPSQYYDQGAPGGVSRVVFNFADYSVASKNAVLGGTVRNCAGGISPWGWLSCEETLVENHGFVFLCDPTASSIQPSRKILPYGRFVHEAATVDPESNTCYLTEDQGASGFYRFVPDVKANPFVGRFQAMKVSGHDRFDTSSQMPLRERLQVEWMTIADQVSSDRPVATQAHDLGAAIIKRGEGLWMGKREVYFSSTNGGPVSGGQIFRLIIGNNGAPDFLELLAESSAREKLDMPDNLTLSPRGSVYLAEDGQNDQYIRCLTRDGGIRDLAKNNMSSSEFAGVCFDPTGTVMFANIQHSGVTLMIRGPFAEFEG
jgi:secreted PhoX family phosphatase